MYSDLSWLASDDAASLRWREAYIATYLERGIPAPEPRIPATTLRRLHAWQGNVRKRLVRAPKVYVRDSGIVHALLGLTGLDSVLAHPVAGASWEGFAIEQLLAATNDAEAGFYRTSHAAEADLVLAFRNGENWVVEIKRASAPTVSRGFHAAAADVGATRKLLVAPVGERYPIRDGVEVMNPITAAALVAAH